uniref:Leucine-rich repeat-containing protein 40 n=1 Tax=Anabas testudineus TaxID=64144 RepID=A0A7N6AJP8_ANATE
MSRFGKAKANNVDSLAGFRAQKKDTVISHGVLNAARKSGQLNLSSRGLSEVPQNVYRLNIDPPEDAHQNVSFDASDRWWEQTDLTKLLLSSNQLTHLSDDIRLLAGLNILDLHDNQLSSLPSALGELQELHQLRLSHNQLTSLPEELCTLKNLRSLTIQQNLLESLPEQVGHLENLSELDLSRNHLKGLPSSLGCLIGLQKLNLCHNKLTCLPDSLRQLKNVKMLDCSNNQLTHIPASLSEMVALEQLYLRHNKLCLLPRLSAPTLKELYVGNNQIEQLETEQLECLTAISILELRDNKLKTIPEQITSLSTLTRLDLTNNDITTLLASLSLLPNLKVLLLEGNPLRGIRRDLLTVGDTNTEQQPLKHRNDPLKLHSLILLFTDIMIKACSTSMTNSSKQADQIPNELFDAAAGEDVTTANFSKNQMTSIPSRLVEFHASLSDINLGFNRLTCCSPDICKLLNLKHIDLRNNQLDELPPEMKNLTKLCSIILNYNRFRFFPEVLYHIVTLETVLLGNNQVSAVDPNRLMKLDHLSTLDLSNNDLLNIPPELGLCTNLRCLILDGNPFRTPRAAILAKGTDAVLEYLRSRITT